MTEHVVDPTPTGGLSVLLFLLSLALTVFVFYLVVRFVRRNLARTGFSGSQVALILWGTLIGSAISLPLVPFGAGYLGINVGGAIIPMFLSIVFIKRRQVAFNEAIVGIVIVAFASYLVTDYVPGTGVISPFPLWLIPPFLAALVAMFAFWRDDHHGAALAYVSGTMGTLIGADVLRLPEILSGPAPEEPVILAIGGAGVFDMVFLSGIIAIALQATDIMQRTSDRIEDALTGRSMGHSISVDEQYETWLAEQKQRRADAAEERAHLEAAREHGDFPRTKTNTRWDPAPMSSGPGAHRYSSPTRDAAERQRVAAQARADARDEPPTRERAEDERKRRAAERKARQRARPTNAERLEGRRRQRMLEQRERREARKRRLDEMRPRRGGRDGERDRRRDGTTS